MENVILDEEKLGQGWYATEVGTHGKLFRWTSAQWSLEGIRCDSGRPYLLCTIESNFPAPTERIIVLADERPVAEWVLVHGQGCYAVAVPESIEQLLFRLSSTLPLAMAPPSARSRSPQCIYSAVASCRAATADMR